MFTLANLQPSAGSTKKRKRVGRGNASGHGTYSGRGMKGQRARSGGKKHSPLEGGRTPLARQIPKKRGFRSIHPKLHAVNLRDLEARFATGATVDAAALVAQKLLADVKQHYKILGQGKLSKKLTVVADAVSASAKTAIEAAGGTIAARKQ